MPLDSTSTTVERPARLSFNRQELAGAFGDIGTDLPLLIALIATCRLDAASVCIMFGVLQIATGVLYGIPMPVQPLKAMATIMLAQHLSANTLAGGGLMIGGMMLLLALTGALDWLARVVPKAVVRGIQLGLGTTLATVALRDYAGADGISGYLLALVSMLALLVLRGQRRIPAPLIVMGLGALYAAAFKLNGVTLLDSWGLRLPVFQVPSRTALLEGALLLALPQVPLSLGNSIIATSQATHDLFPARAVPVRRIGITYGLINLIAPWFGGVPLCHGCGGIVGFHGFGARTGGAPVFYGAMYLLLGLFFSPGFSRVVQVFPLPVLGIVLLFEAIGLMTMLRDVATERESLWIALVVAAAVVGLPYGYVVGMVVGTLITWSARQGWLRTPSLDSKDDSVK